MLSDTISWLQLDSLQILKFENISRTPSSVQQYALTVLELLGDTVIYNAPEINDTPPPRLEDPEIAAKETVTEQAFTLYPNPSNGVFTIKLNTGDAAYNIFVTDLTGRVQLQSTSQSSNNKLLFLNASNLNKGVYLCSVYKDDVLLGTEQLVFIK